METRAVFVAAVFLVLFHVFVGIWNDNWISQWFFLFFFFAVWLQNLNFVKSCIKISLLVCLCNLLVLIDVLSFSFDFSHRWWSWLERQVQGKVRSWHNLLLIQEFHQVVQFCALNPAKLLLYPWEKGSLKNAMDVMKIIQLSATHLIHLPSSLVRR